MENHDTISERGTDNYQRTGEMIMFDEKVLEFFLENQEQLFQKRVAETYEEAEAFLEDCMAVVCKNIGEVREYLDESGMDIVGMDDEDLLDSCEVFALPDGRFLIVEG